MYEETREMQIEVKGIELFSTKFIRSKGGETLNSDVIVSIAEFTDDLVFNQELVNCNVTSDGRTFLSSK